MLSLKISLEVMRQNRQWLLVTLILVVNSNFWKCSCAWKLQAVKLWWQARHFNVTLDPFFFSLINSSRDCRVMACVSGNRQLGLGVLPSLFLRISTAGSWLCLLGLHWKSAPGSMPCLFQPACCWTAPPSLSPWHNCCGGVAWSGHGPCPFPTWTFRFFP